ncbi:ATP synthase F1 subunit delta [Blattabacterium cuenoti]|uniref:ATP synthase F1 subunit delta n=1 Tax=Blattabacterium cuenoti TaxID=1653831 RepID=UPI00163C6751|nr:ATP synthase F1 subunit delta [Blattabacterium cuenoti]
MFSRKKIIQHYAKVFFEYSIENRKNSEILYYKIKKISFFLKKNIELRNVIETSLLDSEKKIKIYKSIFYNFDILFFQFFKLLIIKKREHLLKEILLEYQKIYEKNQKKLITIIIISAFPLKKEIQEIIVNKIMHNKKKIHIINKIDKSIIGGFLFRVGYKEWDFSVKKQLSSIKKKFQNF